MRYGDDPSQHADLRLPTGRATVTVVLLHGGYWLPQYGADLMEPLATALGSAGCATWNVEYRRTQAGGGWPTTFTDVAAAVDLLAEQAVPRRTVLLGHSAGGHLAAWAASRTSRTPGGAPRVSPDRVVSLAGVLDLTAGARQPQSAAPVRTLMGGTPEQHPDRYALGDPARLVPAPCPVIAVQDEDEQVIDPRQGPAYVARARAAGGSARSVTVPGDHFSLIDPEADSYPTLRRLVLDGTPR